MTDRERLIELIKNTDFADEYECKLCDKEIDYCEHCNCSRIADYLLANGVIVPPFKFGSTIWIIRNREIYPHKIDHLVISEFGMYSTGISLKWCVGKLGKTVFLTKEDAEEKLKELGK